MSVSTGVIGGMAAMTASAITHPADTLKVRMYLHGEGRGDRSLSLRAKSTQMYANEGLRNGFLRGMSAMWMRQMLYSTARFGVNESLQSRLGKTARCDITVLKKILSGAGAGLAAAVVSCPADMVQTRMQADGHLCRTEQRRYKNVFTGLNTVVRQEGAGALYRGLRPLLLRSCLVTAGQFTTYDVTKRALITNGYADVARTHLFAATVAGCISALIVNPLDVIKARMMHSQDRPVNESITTLRHYKSNWHCAQQTYHVEGISGFYKGIVPCLIRSCPQVILMWVIYEQYSKLFKYMSAPVPASEVAEAR